MSNPRQPAHPINPMFVNRWSPRALTGEAISRDQLNTILEAARWAPSAYNYQPWRFIYALRDTAQWGPIFDGVKEGNRTWVKDGSALIVLAAVETTRKFRTPPLPIVFAHQLGSAKTAGPASS